jgi:hypothetical protein
MTIIIAIITIDETQNITDKEHIRSLFVPVTYPAVQLLIPTLVIHSQIAFCVQWGILDSDPLIFTEALNWAVSYELPNQTIRNPDTNRLVVPYILRRNRRELYQKLEVAMDS